MTEEQYFEQFVGDTARLFALGVYSGNDFDITQTAAQQWLKNTQQQDPDRTYYLDYEQGESTPLLGEHRFYLMLQTPA